MSLPARVELRPARPVMSAAPCRHRHAEGPGLKLYLLATAEGIPAAWYLAEPKIGEREVAAEFLARARDTGPLRD